MGPTGPRNSTFAAGWLRDAPAELALLSGRSMCVQFELARQMTRGSLRLRGAGVCSSKSGEGAGVQDVRSTSSRPALSGLTRAGAQLPGDLTCKLYKDTALSPPLQSPVNNKEKNSI